jgi:lysylphosphatidylglycerol synthetase-like protein (DUF2156 family)
MERIKNISNTYLKTYLLIALGFIVLDSVQLLFYPLIMLGYLENVESLIRSQLPDILKNIPIYIVFTALILNVVLRWLAFSFVLKKSVSGLVLGVISNIYTILVVVFLLTLNLVWETVVMCLLTIILILGYRREFQAKNP